MISVSIPRECRPPRQRIERLRAQRAKNQRPKHMRCKRSADTSSGTGAEKQQEK